MLRHPPNPSRGCQAPAGISECLPSFLPNTHAVESLNSRFGKAMQRRTHFPNDTAALKVLYLVA
jgi:transposase-like protein